MMQPMMNEIIAESNTAAADMSLIFLIVGFIEGQTKSHNFSIAEFMISKLKTTAKQIKMTIYSVELIEKKSPAATTNNEMTNCSPKFFSWGK